MCGIVAIYAYKASAPAVDANELRMIRDHMAARGPDGKGEWISESGRVGLGHRRLAIIDRDERANQPMRSADGKLAIVFNGEIYNFRELRQGLENRGYRFRTESDTEVMLQLYAEKGQAMLHDLRGMFALAIWDAQQHTLFLARDPFGIKPLYYANHNGTFRCASQVKALLCAPVDTTPEPAGQVGFMLWGSVPEPWTMVKGILALPAGHWLKVDRAGAGEPVRWCDIGMVLAEAATAPTGLDRRSSIDCVAAAIADSVRAHQVADVPVGTFLSAGIDSGMIADLVATPGTRPYTLTLGFEEFAGTEDDEVPLAQALARTLDAVHTTRMVRRQDFEDEREKLLAAMDQPSIDGVNTWFISRAAASMQLKSVLSGLGGDELFASYPSFREVPTLVRYGRPFRALPTLGRALRKAAALLPRNASPKIAGLLEYSASMGSAYLLRRCLHTPWELPQLLGVELTAAGLARLQTLPTLASTTNGNRNDRLQVSALEMNWYMRNQLLRDTDWASMAHSLEIRVPLVDLPLLRTVAPIFAAHPDIGKAELAAVAAPRLSHQSRNRAKTGFSIPVRAWLPAPRAGERGRGLRDWAQFIYQHSQGTAR